MNSFEEKVLDVLAEMRQEMNSRLDSMATKADLENEILKVNIRIETDIMPKLDALAEGHAAILEQLVPVSRVDELENRVKFLESMLHNVVDQLQQLKQAQ